MCSSVVRRPPRRAVSLAVGLVAGTAVVLTPGLGDAQEPRSVVAKQISVGGDAATLALEFADGGRLEVSLRDGGVSIDGRSVGSYRSDTGLYASWRSLLGDAVALENGALARAVIAWEPPTDLGAEEMETARDLDRALESALARPAEPEPDEPSVSAGGAAVAEQAMERLLVRFPDRLAVLGEALSETAADAGIRMFVDEDFTLEEGERIRGTVLVVDGHARVGGEVGGDLVVVGGSVSLEETGVVTGTLRLADTRLISNRGTVGGGVSDLRVEERAIEDSLRDRIRQEIREEIRGDLRRELRNVTRSNDDGFSLLSPFRSVVRGVGGLIETALVVLVLGILGAALASFAGSELDTVSAAVRRNPGRAAAVGIAGVFLALPVWVLGLVALVVSIVGIPVALAWIPLFPAALALAGIAGLVAVAQNVGVWLSGTDYPWTERIRSSNAVHTIGAGLVVLMLPFAAAHAISILPFMGLLSGLLNFLGTLAVTAAILAGFGAVLLTRGGRVRDTWNVDPEDAWAAALDDDPVAAGETPEPAGSDTASGPAFEDSEGDPHA